jgi:hypothetical protein
MKNTLLKVVLLLMMSLMVSCQKDNDQICELANPLELEWMTDLIMAVDESCSTCEISIFQATYKRKSVFYTSMTAPACSWVFSVDLFNCSGEFVKHFNSSEQDQFYDKVSDRLKIYSCE